MHPTPDPRHEPVKLSVDGVFDRAVYAVLEAASAVAHAALPEFTVPLTVPKPRVQPVPKTKPVHEVSPIFPVMTVSARFVAGLVTCVVARTA